MSRNITFYDTPVPHLIIDNVFPDDIANEMFNEVKTLNNDFICGFTPSGEFMDKGYRTNKVLFIDQKYNDRSQSVILSSIGNLMLDDELSSIISSIPSFELNQMSKTNYHETQISRYGDKGQKYEWHLDTLNNDRRMITLVYYFNNDKKWTGGEIELTNSPIYNGELKNMNDKEPVIKSIVPKPNSVVIFSGHTPHRVNPTISPELFEHGRFSANVWIGMK